MNTVEGVSLGTGSAILAYLIAKLEIIEKVYSFIKKLFGEKATVNVENVSGTVGDVAGGDINKNRYDQHRRSGDVYNMLSGPQRPLLKQTVKLHLAISDPALQARLQRIWNEHNLPGNERLWFIDYVNAVLDSDEFLERLGAEEDRYASDGWELESIESFDNTWNKGNHGFDCQLFFVKAIPRRAAAATAR